MSYSQLITNSDIDQLLVGNPQITYFKSVYRRHTPFYKGLYTYDEVVNTNSDKNNISKEINSGSFDLITDIFIENKIVNNTSNSFNYTANLGNSIIDNIKLNVGQQQLHGTNNDYDGLYMEARSELDNPFIPSINGSIVPPYLVNNTSGSLTCNIGNMYNISTFAGGVSGSLSNASSTDIFYTYPNFYFCREYGSSFPICALNNTRTEIVVTFRDMDRYVARAGDMDGIKLHSKLNLEYVILSYDERARFINNTDIYIYYDIIKNNGTDLKSSHPLRQIFFIGNPPNARSTTSSLSTPVKIDANAIEIFINNQLISDNNKLSLYTRQNLNKLYKGYGRELFNGTSPEPKGYLDSIGVYSFALDTTNTPSGHLNANTNIECRIIGTDNIIIYLEVIKFYRIMGGQLQILYI